MSRIYNCTPHVIRIPDMVRGEGIYVFDSRGKRYMDLESGVWCTSLGHSHKRITKRIKEQVDRMMHVGFCYENRLSESAAEMVTEVSGLKDAECVFLCSGSEAIELARQIAKTTTGLPTSMTLHDSYLGSYSSVVNRDLAWFIFDWRSCEACRYRDNCRPDCEKLREIPGNISEFILEPGSSSGFVRFPPVSLVRNIVKIVRLNGGKIVSNEVTTGIGRTGKWFGFEHYGIEPDMIAMGKGVGNGYPVSVTVLSNRTAAEAAGAGFRYMQSHQNDPLGAMIAGEVISLIREGDLIRQAEENGKFFLKQLMELEDGKFVTGVRGRGLMFGVDLCDRETGDRIYDKLLEKGYIVCNRGALFRIDPPLIISRQQFRKFVDDLRTILSGLKKNGQNR